MTDALGRQYGGKHYKTFGIQPMEFSMARGYDPCTHTAVKYLTRHKSKAGLEDVQKAFHCIELHRQLYPVSFWRIAQHTIRRFLGLDVGMGRAPDEETAQVTVEAYIHANRIGQPESYALILIDRLFENAGFDSRDYDNALGAIDAVALYHYGTHIA